jgi:glycosyltransferase involved in cell wall biosynthesis
MKISVYTAMRDCIRHDYPYLDMIRHHLPLADEIVINEGFSTDGTYETLQGLDSKVRVFRTKWNQESGENWWIHFKDAARRQCTGDWCVHLDSDEFLPDWEFDRLRQQLSTTAEMMLPVRFVNFYGNCRVFHSDPGKSHWVTRKMIIHRNDQDAIEFWGDGSNVRLKGQEFSWGDGEPKFDVHHFGGVRHAGRLRQSWWLQGRFRTGRSIAIRPPQWVFDLFPAKWEDPDFIEYLAIYEGPLIKAVRDNPRRFARDGFELLRTLAARTSDKNGYAP